VRVEGPLTIRPEQPADFPAIDAVIVDAFGPEHGPAVTHLVERIRASEDYIPAFALVAEHDDAVVAHVLLSWVGIESDLRDRILNLTPMSVRSDCQRLGVGTQLIDAVLRRAEDAGEPVVMVQGVPAYYPRFGFERATPLGFGVPYEGILDAAFMVKRLPGFSAGLAGRVIYPAAFDHLPH
jgi:putative acetyltransferase